MDFVLATIFSKPLDRTGRIDTGHTWSLDVGPSTFGIGDIRAIFHCLGKWLLLMQVLIMFINGPAK